MISVHDLLGMNEPNTKFDPYHETHTGVRYIGVSVNPDVVSKPS